MNVPTQTIGFAIGSLAIGWVLAQAVLVGVKTWRLQARRERECARGQAEFRRRVDAAAQAARATHAIPDWEGWRPFRVAAIVDEARDVKSFYLTPVDGQLLAPFAPGQYLTFKIPLPGGTPLVRCYSLSDRPREDFYRCTVRRVAAPADRPELPPGRGSNFFHDRVKVGDVLETQAPAGMFLVDPQSSEPIVLAGSGIGVTPLVSMLDAIVHAGRQREVYAVFGFRDGRSHPFRELLQQLARENPHIHLLVSYSAPGPDDTLHREYNHDGRVTIERLREVLPSNNFRFYVCGPGRMMESLVPALWKWGVPETHVHFEAFGPASVKRVNAGRSAGAAAAPCQVRFARSDRAVRWDGKFDSLLEFGLAAGVSLTSGCRAGSCGECLTAVLSGKIVPLKQPGIRVPDGHCLTCISVPVSELVLDA